VFFETKKVRQPMFDVEAFLSHHSDRRITDLIDEEQFDFLEHYGVKGMRWGVSRNMPGAPGRASTERKVADKTYFKDKEHGRRALTNKELADYNKRLQLENNFLKLRETSAAQKAMIAGAAFAVGVGATLLKGHVTNVAIVKFNKIKAVEAAAKAAKAAKEAGKTAKEVKDATGL
jgi:hypothetical protein